MVTAYDPKDTSEATGFTIRQLDEHQRTLVSHAAKFVIATGYCRYSYFMGDNPLTAMMEKLGVHPYDFKKHTREFTRGTLKLIRTKTTWRKFCGEAYYQLYGPDSYLFGPKGEYPDLEPWIRRIEIKEGMTKAQVRAEIDFNVAYNAALHCAPGFFEFEHDKVEAYRKKHRLDDKWYAATADQNFAFLNEATLRVGPPELIDCKKYRRKFRQLMPRR